MIQVYPCVLETYKQFCLKAKHIPLKTEKKITVMASKYYYGIENGVSKSINNGTCGTF